MFLSLYTRIPAEQLGLFQPLQVIIVHLHRLSYEISKRTGTQLWPFPLCLGPECVTKTCCLDNHFGLVLFDSILRRGIVANEAHG